MPVNQKLTVLSGLSAHTGADWHKIQISLLNYMYTGFSIRNFATGQKSVWGSQFCTQGFTFLPPLNENPVYIPIRFSHLLILIIPHTASTSKFLDVQAELKLKYSYMEFGLPSCQFHWIINNLYSFNFLSFIFVPVLLTVKILKIGTPEIITIIVPQLEQIDFTVQYCVQKMQTE